jgi:preprotein translocase subunit SecG
MLDKFLPPTDNLYKFVAISGLLFIVLSFYPNYLNFKLGEQKIEHLKNLNILNIELKNLVEESEQISKKANEIKDKASELFEGMKKNSETIKSAAQNAQNKNIKTAKILQNEFLSNDKVNEISRNELNENELKINDADLQNQEKMKQQKIKLAELNSTSELIGYYNEQISWLKTLSKLIFTSGLIFVATGFYFWLVKHQMPNDKLLWNQSNEKQSTKSRKHHRIKFF